MHRPTSVRRAAGAVLALTFAALLATAGSAAASPAGSTLLVSRPDGLAPPPQALDNSSTTPAVSPDGRYIAFTSLADGIAPGVDGRFNSVVVRDTQTNTTTLASRSDGVDGAAANAGAKTLAVAVEPGATAPDPPADQPHVLVVFSTGATNLVDHATGAVVAGGAGEIWMRDVTAATTYLVSRLDGPTGAPGDAASEQAALVVGPAGPLVAFRSRATNLPGGAVPGQPRNGIFLREVNQGATTYVSCRANCGVPTTSFSADPAIAISNASASHNGFCPMNTDQKCLEVAFATNDVPITGDPGSHEQVVVATSVLGATGRPTTFAFTTMSSLPAVGGGTTFGNDMSRRPSLSGDGLAVGYISRATNLLPGGGAVRDRGIIEFSNGFMQFAARNQNGAVANIDIDGISVGGSLASGITFAFASAATNLGIDSAHNPFLFDHAYRGSVDANAVVQPARPIDRAPDGTPGDNPVASDPGPQISADGSTVAFDTRSTNLGGGPDFERIYAVAGATGTPTVVSRPSGTDPFPAAVVESTIGARNNMVGLRVVSADGRYVAFTSSTDNLAPGENNAVVAVFVRDLVAGTTTLVSRADGQDGAAANDESLLNGISDDGRRVMFTSAATNLDADTRAVSHVYVRDLDRNTTTTVSRQSGTGGTVVSGDGIALSGDGDSALFVSLAAIDPDAAGGATVVHLYVRRLSANTTTLIDRDNGLHGAVAGSDPDGAAIDRDGNRVVWATSALFTGSPFPPRELLYMRDVGANVTSLVSRASGATGALPNAAVTLPAISGDGDVVAFASAATNLGAPVTSKQLWVRRLSGDQTTQLASRATGADGAVPDSISFAPVLDDAGDKLAFVSLGQNIGAPKVFPGDYGYVRDLSAQTTDVINRADTTGEPADIPGVTSVSISASGNCAAFSSTGTNLADGFPSADFAAVRLRVLSGTCNTDPVALQIPPPDLAPVTTEPVTTEPTGRHATTPRAAVSRLRLAPSRFRVRGRHRGTTISFSLNRSARVTLRFEALRSGHRHGRRCVAGARHGRRCTIVHRAGSLLRSSRTGTNRVHFLGSLHGRRLKPGRYRLTATPLGGRTVTAPFTVR